VGGKQRKHQSGGRRERAFFDIVFCSSVIERLTVRHV
jgi:hypothetical protein